MSTGWFMTLYYERHIYLLPCSTLYVPAWCISGMANRLRVERIESPVLPHASRAMTQRQCQGQKNLKSGN